MMKKTSIHDKKVSHNTSPSLISGGGVSMSHSLIIRSLVCSFLISSSVATHAGLKRNVDKDILMRILTNSVKNESTYYKPSENEDNQRFKKAMAINDKSPGQTSSGDGKISKNELALNAGITGDESHFLRSVVGIPDGFIDEKELMKYEAFEIIDVSDTGQISLTDLGQEIAVYYVRGDGRLIIDLHRIDTDNNFKLEGKELDKFISEFVVTEHQAGFRYLYDNYTKNTIDDYITDGELRLLFDEDYITMDSDGKIVLTILILDGLPTHMGGMLSPQVAAFHSSDRNNNWVIKSQEFTHFMRENIPKAQRAAFRWNFNNGTPNIKNDDKMNFKQMKELVDKKYLIADEDGNISLSVQFLTKVRNQGGPSLTSK